MNRPGSCHPAQYVGCAGWSLPREHWPAFDEQGTHLQRYASRFNAVEINSSFYRPHRPQTYARWAASVPLAFRFAVKVPKAITHERRLHDCETLLDEFLAQCTELGARLGCLLVQLPPSLAFTADSAEQFLDALRARFVGDVVLEPRHESWRLAEQLLIERRVARVAADPAPFHGADLPGGWPGLRYWRLHGSPQIYHSAYGQDRVQRIAADIRAWGSETVPSWCIFDNTASGAAVADALLLDSLLRD
ncbi:DUF72 domain-containing protein [Pseudomonas sp. v388]|uniref:DUF72 domain-containing protein n=1 Tax=Pseudomonas sp. v388 TaxID=2479849 RepID=UPI000F76D519|nr:DUF72 domain-containing protein [Pseudomonas sp. v388]RRV10344.1 DUF72 domain-containing protein [Pseudomonas sp. v388]